MWSPECNEEHGIMPGTSQGCGAAMSEEGSFRGSLPRCVSHYGNCRALQEWGREAVGDSGCAEGVCPHPVSGNAALPMLSFAP